MVVLWYIFLAFLLLFGLKIFRNKTWNSENLSLNQTKSFLGFCSIVIVFHHLAQDTCGPWLDPEYFRPGLDVFLSAGYPMVSVFFFCSGFGLYRSAKTKPVFFKRFLPARLIPILIPSLITVNVFLVLYRINGLPLKINNPFTASGHETLHPYIWYIPCIIFLYILFYIGFGLIKNDRIGIILVILGTLGYIIYCISFAYEAHWFNSIHMFAVGILASKYENKIFNSCTKHYEIKLIGTAALTVIFGFLAEESGNMYLILNDLPNDNVNGYKARLIGALFQVIFTLLFMSLYYLITLKVQFGNKILTFLGKTTLELYLVHGIFVKLFGIYMFNDSHPPRIFIKNVSLLTLVVLGLSIPIAFGLSIIDKKIGGILKKNSKQL